MIHVTITPDDLLDEESLRSMLKIPQAVLRRAKRNGALRAHRLGNRHYYIGDELVAWLRNQPANGADDEGDE